MSDTLQRVAFSKCGSAAVSFQRSVISSLTVDDVVALLKQAIVAKDLWILHEIDPQMLLNRGGFAIGPARQLLFFHPRLMSRLLVADTAALLEAPLKFAVIGYPDAKTEVRWNDPAKAFARYDLPALTTFGNELASLCEDIVTGIDLQGASK